MILGETGIDVFPTRVGVDRYTTQTEKVRVGFPHTRGGGPIGRVEFHLFYEFSPHAWGWTCLPGEPG